MIGSKYFDFESLNNIVSESESFGAFKKTLQTVSRNIHALEQHYLEQKISTPFEMVVGEEIASTGMIDSESDEYCSVIVKIANVLAWQEYRNEGFRLMLLQKQERGIFQQEGLDFGLGDYNLSCGTLNQAPLIESKAEVLIKMHSHLREFHEAFSEVSKKSVSLREHFVKIVND